MCVDVIARKGDDLGVLAESTANCCKVSINILVSGDTEARIIAEFEGAEEYTERTFPVEKLSGKCKVSFTFLPGSDFDFKSFRFVK